MYMFLIALIALGDMRVNVYTLTTPRITDTVFVAPDSTDDEFAVYVKEFYQHGEDVARSRVEQLRLQDELKQLALLLYGNEEENQDEWSMLFELPAYALEGHDGPEPAWVVYLNIRREAEALVTKLTKSPQGQGG